MSLAGALTALKQDITGVVRVREALARHTTYRIGGPAAALVEADTVGDLKRAIAICHDSGVGCVVLGKGSNILASDAGYDGVVIVLGREFKRHEVEGDRIHTGAGVVLGHVVQDAYSRGLSGLEFGVGVPGTIGGALAMNAGSRTEWIGGMVESITLLDRDLNLISVRGADIEWGYRSTNLSAWGVVVECVLSLAAGDKESIRRTMDMSLLRRKKSQPMGVPSAGSVFRNPEGDSAGRLIEASGLKGAQVGGAQISEIHANFIVNRGGAAATDVVELMNRAHAAVKEHHGIELTPEIKLLGPFDGS